MSKVYYGFIEINNPTAIVIHNEPAFVKPQNQEKIIENGIAIKAEPVVEIGKSREEVDLSELVNQIIEQEQQVENEKESKNALKVTFETWQSLIDIEKNIIKDEKESFRYQKKDYDSQKQLLILTLEKEISIEYFDKITSPYLPVTISVAKKSHNNRKQEFQEAIGDIIDGDKSENGESVITLHISIGDFCNPEVIKSILDKGKVETNFKAQESEIKKRHKALREIRYGDSENTEICQIIVNPANIKQIEPILIRDYFNQQLDESQQKAVNKALATEDIFLIQGPPGTGKTSVITEIILQILKRHPNDNILISSQSNVAVDNVLSRIARVGDKDIKCIRIGREEKIAENARQFEVEKAILKWQNEISSKSLAYWEDYKDKNGQILSGVEKIAQLEDIKNKNQELQLLITRLSKTINRFNSELLISKENTASVEFSDIALELIYEKLELEQKILKCIETYTRKFGIEYPEQKQLAIWINEEYKVLQNILGDNQVNYQRFIRLGNLNKDWNEKLNRKQQNLQSLFIDEINVVGATCLGVGRYKNRNFDWVIIDEAGRSTASETFVPMSKGKKIILVGDHRQLPPIIDRELQERALSEQEIQKKLLETSLFEYFYEN